MACTNLITQFPSTLATSLASNSRSPLPWAFYRDSRRGRARAFSKSIGTVRPELDENPEAIISGEWPDNFSFLSFDDLRAYLEAHTSNDGLKVGPSMMLREVMSTSITIATAEQTLEEINSAFERVTGMPVVNGELRCIGVISKRDRDRASQGLKSKVGEVMSSPAITLPPNKTVQDAAALMLKMKIHRIPIVNERTQVIGMVTRTDIFQALLAVDED